MGGGESSVVLIMAKPWADGVLVTGNGADGVRVTGYINAPEPGTVSLGPRAADEADLACALGVVAMEEAARSLDSTKATQTLDNYESFMHVLKSYCKKISSMFSF